MTPIDPNDVKDAAHAASDYWGVLHRIGPISTMGGVVALVTNLSRIAGEKEWARRIFMCVSVVSVGCMAAGVAALGLTLFIASPPMEMELLAGAIAGSSGQKIFDVYSRKLFGIKTRAQDLTQDSSTEAKE